MEETGQDSPGGTPADAHDITGPALREGEAVPFEIAGFWRRLGAFLIDLLMLSVPLLIFGFALRDLAYSLGPWGRIVGYGVLLLYWGCFNSRLGGGQTVGKRCLEARVVDGHGACLSPGKAMLRALILLPIGLLNGWAVPLLENPIAAVIATTAVFGGGLSLLYAMLFNRRTRQGIHDLIVGSYVVKTIPKPGTIAARTPGFHRHVTYGLVAAGLALALVGYLPEGVHPLSEIVDRQEWQQLHRLHAALSEDDRFFTVHVQGVKRRILGNLDVPRGLKIQIWLKRPWTNDPQYCDALLKQIAHTAFEQYEGIDDLSGMRVALVNRFDFGLARWSVTRGAAWTIADWRKELEQSRLQKSARVLYTSHLATTAAQEDEAG